MIDFDRWRSFACLLWFIATGMDKVNRSFNPFLHRGRQVKSSFYKNLAKSFCDNFIRNFFPGVVVSRKDFCNIGDEALATLRSTYVLLKGRTAQRDIKAERRQGGDGEALELPDDAARRRRPVRVVERFSPPPFCVVEIRRG
jgi:hypothetical protein